MNQDTVYTGKEVAKFHPSLLSLWCLQRKVPGVGRWTLCVCVMGRVTGTGQAGGHKVEGPGQADG